MQQLFISHAEEDWAFAAELGEALEQRGFTVWYYERDCLPGPAYLKQVVQAIAECQGVVLIVSPISMDSHQVDAEVYRAFETKKRFVPVLWGVSHDEFAAQKSDWTMAMRAATSIRVPPSGLSSILDQIEKGVKMLGVSPAAPAPKPASPRPRPAPPRARKKSAKPKSDAVAWTVFGPRECSPGDTSLFQVLLHTPEQAEEAGRLARKADSEAQPRAAGEVEELLSRGEPVRLVFRSKGVEVQEPAAEVIWDGSPQVVQFAVPVPVDNQPAKQFAQVRLYRGLAPVAHLSFTLRVNEPAPPPEPAPVQSFQPVRRAYLCYAAADRAEVLRRAQFLSSMGISVFVDAIGIEIGQNWRDQIRRMIEQADVFFLFWSEAASRSQEVLHEVDYALRLTGGDPDKRPHIIPIALSMPMPEPPPQLASVQFLDTLAYFVAPEAARETK